MLKKLIFLLLSATLLYAAETGSDLVEVEVIPAYAEISDKTKIVPVALKFKIEDGWHIYWRNPGDSGLPTEINWEEGKFTTTDIQWPIPEKIPFTGLANYGFEDEVVLFTAIRLERNLIDNLEVNANISWLVCKEACLPGDQDISFELPMGREISNPEYNKLQQKYKAEMPFSTDIIRATGKITEDELVITIDDENLPKDVQFFPYEPGFIVNGPEQEVEKLGNKTIIKIEMDTYRYENPKSLKGLLISNEGIDLSKQVEKYKAIVINFPIN